jgi:hypothetical protein
MSISSVSSAAAAAPVKAPEATEAKAPDVKTDADASDANAHQPVVLAPLPPGQGMRINQLV